ncbi:MAG: MFS transporter [Gemmatimonadota bacterium]
MNTRRSDGRLLPILSVAFVGSLGFSIVLPFLVFVVTRLGGNALVYGAVGATYSALQLIGAPILGRWSDRHGRRKILLLSQIGTLLSWVVFLGALYLPVTPIASIDSSLLGSFTLTVPLAVLFLARALDGLTGGNVSVANAYLADITDEKDRSANFGKMAVASNLGFVLGPAIAGLLGDTAAGEVPPVMAAIAVSVVASLIIFFRLPESRPTLLDSRVGDHSVGNVLGQEHKECYTVEEPHEVGLAEALRPAGIRLLLGVHFLVFLAFNFMYIALPVHAATRLEWTLTEVGIFFSVLGLMMTVVQGPILGALTKVTGDRTLLHGGTLILAFGFALYSFPSVPMIYAGAAGVALGNGLMWPSLLALISRAADDRAQGAVQGFASSSSAVASISGLLVGGLLYDRMGGSIFLVSAAITTVALIVSFIPAVHDHGPNGEGDVDSVGDVASV